jgi:hypothetical protein
MESPNDTGTNYLQASFIGRTHGEPQGHKHRLSISSFHRHSTWTATGTQAQASYKLLS